MIIIVIVVIIVIILMFILISIIIVTTMIVGGLYLLIMLSLCVIHLVVSSFKTSNLLYKLSLNVMINLSIVCRCCPPYNAD